MDELLTAERDSLVTLALLSRVYLQFDPPISVGSATPTHFAGLNIHSCVIDNVDGEVLALDRNSIHADQSPVQHGEQRAVRAAIQRILQKRPRPAGMTIESYYRSNMFMAAGAQPGDFVRVGCSLYNTLDPCPMCASTLLVVRMKRVSYVVPDLKFHGVWEHLKQTYYAADESIHNRISLSAANSPLIADTRQLVDDLDKKIAQLRADGVRDTHLFDHCRDLMVRAVDALRPLTDAALVTTGADKDRNARTLLDLKRLCNFST